MAPRKATKPAAKSALPAKPVRKAVTFELVQTLAPTETLADKLVQTFGLSPVDYEGIRDTTKESLMAAGHALSAALNEPALRVHMQRITFSYVNSAYYTAVFYGTKKSAAIEMTNRLLNDARDEDRDGPAGFDSRSEQARHFAAETGLQAFATMAAAEGALAAYAEVVGEDWKPYVASAPASSTVGRQSAAAELAAFRGE